MKIDKGANVMAEQSMGPRDFFRKEAAIADLALLACPGAEELCNLVDGHLVRWAREVGMDVDTFIIPSDCMAAASIAASAAKAWTALTLCSSCAPWALRTLLPLMLMTPA